jgi:hypothetical protein
MYMFFHRARPASLRHSGRALIGVPAGADGGLNRPAPRRAEIIDCV